MKFRMYVINATEYGKGNEVGTWLDLPMTCNELEDTLEKIGVSSMGNYIIMDVETNLPFEYPIDEETSIEYLNSLAISLAEIACKGDLEWLTAYMDEIGCSLEAALDNYEKHSYYDVDNAVISIY